MSYLYLGLAIVSEVIATLSLKAAEGFTQTVPSIIVVLGYGSAFFFLSLVLKTLPIGITYAIWSDMGVVLISLFSAILYQQIPDLAAIIGMLLIVSGVIVIQVFSSTAHG